MANSSVSELEKIAEHLKAYDKDYKDREKKLEEERRKIDSEKKVVERANRESESALMRLAEEQKKENDKLCCTITQLQNDLKPSRSLASILKRDNGELLCKIGELKKNHEDDIRLAGEQKEENEELRSRINKVEEKLENALKLAGERQMEKEKLHKRFTQKKLQSEKALKLALEVIREFNEDGEFGRKDKVDGKVEHQNKTDAISRGSKEKDEYIEHLESLNNILTVKELKSKDELQKTRKEHGLLDSQAYIGVKTMGTVDNNPFQTAIKRQYVAEGTKKKLTAYKATVGKGKIKEEYEQATIDKQAVELCTLWEDYRRDANWHPFKVIRMGGDNKEVIDEEDEELKTLREELGNEAYEAVTTALIEMNDYNNPSGRYPVRELWNFIREERKATVKEGVSYLLKHVKLFKRRRTAS